MLGENRTRIDALLRYECSRGAGDHSSRPRMKPIGTSTETSRPRNRSGIHEGARIRLTTRTACSSSMRKPLVRPTEIWLDETVFIDAHVHQGRSAPGPATRFLGIVRFLHRQADFARDLSFRERSAFFLGERRARGRCDALGAAAGRRELCAWTTPVLEPLSFPSRQAQGRGETMRPLLRRAGPEPGLVSCSHFRLCAGRAPAAAAVYRVGVRREA